MSGAQQPDANGVVQTIQHRYPDKRLSDETAKLFLRVLNTLDSDIDKGGERVKQEFSDAAAAIRSNR